MADAGTLQKRLLAWMRGEAGGFGSFEEAAMEIFAFQSHHNRPYRNYCQALGKTPGNVANWRGIPALPTDAFKFPEHRPRSFPADRVTRFFLTSGTTREIRGCHEFENLELYETSIRESWRQSGLPDISNPWFLSQSPEHAPHSSLVHMFETLAGAGSARWLIDPAGEIGIEGLVSQIQPVALFSTALALLRLMESHAPVPLPAGSWVFETGGYKGLSETIDPAEFRRRVGEFFEIPADRILNEYSMTELSSQFYRWPDEAAHRGPFWTRIRVIDPETGLAASDGEPGYLEIVDLANLGSVLAIRTQDIAIARGDSKFTLLGRDPSALPRGCSRSADDLLKPR